MLQNNRRVVFMVIFLASGLIFTNCDSNTTKKTPPNIIILLADDLGYADVGFHGSDIQTPNIDRIATEGVRLERFYSAPVCSPTRAGLMTGRYPLRFGMMRAVIPPYRDFGLDPNEDIIPEMLQRAGYDYRACIGKWHLGHLREKWLPNNQGFTHFYGCYNGAVDYFTHERDGAIDWHRNEETVLEEGYTTDLIAKEASQFIESVPNTESYFLYVSFNAPHSPFQAKVEDLKKYEHRPKGKKRTYAAMVDAMDQGIGNILKTIEARGDLDRTFILFFSDNGGIRNVASNAPMQGHKFTVFEGGIRVAAAALWKAGGVSGGKVISDHMGYIDVFPTLMDLVGLQDTPIKPLDGISILASLKGNKSQKERTWFSYIDQSKERMEHLAFHQGDKKLIIDRPAIDHQNLEAPDQAFLYEVAGTSIANIDSANTSSEIKVQLEKKIDSMLLFKSKHQVERYFVRVGKFAVPKDWIIQDKK
ncbi:MAG: arylsulfatase [Bacteroidota bacterium]